MMQENALMATNLRNSTLRAMTLVAENAENLDNPEQALDAAQQLIDKMTPSDMQKMMKDAEDRGFGQSEQVIDLKAGVEIEVVESDDRKLAMSMLAMATASYHREIKDVTGVADAIEAEVPSNMTATEAEARIAERTKPVRQGRPRR